MTSWLGTGMSQAFFTVWGTTRVVSPAFFLLSALLKKLCRNNERFATEKSARSNKVTKIHAIWTGLKLL